MSKIYLCKICGETRPENFYDGNKSKCKRCSSTTKKEYNPHKTVNRRVKPYKCCICGESRPENFYTGIKTECKRCKSDSRKEYNPHKTTVVVDEHGVRQKIHKCHVCGESRPEKFGKSNKGRCIVCQNKHNQKVFRSNYIPKKRVMRMPKSCKCNICGETDPKKFSKGVKSYCKTCGHVKKYHGVSNPEEILKIIEDRKIVKLKPYLCETCGETRPENFRENNKNRCKACLSKKINGKAKKRESKPYLCEKCGETHPEKFYAKRRTMCSACQLDLAREKRWSKIKIKKLTAGKIISTITKRRKIIAKLVKSTNRKPFVVRKKNRLTQETYINKIKEYNGGRYTFEKTKFTNRDSLVTVTCAKHLCDITKKAYVFIRNVHGTPPTYGCCSECRKEYLLNRQASKPQRIPKPPRIPKLKVPKVRKLLFVYHASGKYYPCEIHGEVKVGANRKFTKGCPTCNIERYKASIVNKVQYASCNPKKATPPKRTTPIPQKVYASYEEAKKRVNAAGICSSKEYRLWRKRMCQDDLPYKPEEVYRGKGWIDYYEFFGTDRFGRMSGGERRIYKYLERKGLEFKWQKKFDDCRNIHCLVFDFYLPSLNVLIEYDGEQHFKMANFSTSNDVNKLKFEQLQKNDKIKTTYCQDKGITLIRLDTYHLLNNIIEWELDNDLSRIAAEIAIQTM